LQLEIASYHNRNETVSAFLDGLFLDGLVAMSLLANQDVLKCADLTAGWTIWDGYPQRTTFLEI
jgi:hypothetical protein